MQFRNIPKLQHICLTVSSRAETKSQNLLFCIKRGHFHQLGRVHCANCAQGVKIAQNCTVAAFFCLPGSTCSSRKWGKEFSREKHCAHTLLLLCCAAAVHTLLLSSAAASQPSHHQRRLPLGLLPGPAAAAAPRCSEGTAVSSQHRAPAGREEASNSVLHFLAVREKHACKLRNTAHLMMVLKKCVLQHLRETCEITG